ncbi:Right handed beta helix region [Micrococcales bacterium KH10]|nr:Right handed beta helix region [Micrococcales bacterium KH10]
MRRESSRPFVPFSALFVALACVLGVSLATVADRSAVAATQDATTVALPPILESVTKQQIADRDGNDRTAIAKKRKNLNQRIKKRNKKFKTFRVSPKTKPNKNGFAKKLGKKNYPKWTSYNKHTKHYYMLRSYLEVLEKRGGGKLVLRKGKYRVPGALFVPSNVTIKLKPGAKLIKTRTTGTTALRPSNALIHTVRPSVGLKGGTAAKYRLKGYKGEKNISILGSKKGKPSVINMSGLYPGHSIAAGHTKRLTIRNIVFKGANASHYIELDASKNVVIAKNTFKKMKQSWCGCKEAINVDTPDVLNDSFPFFWSSQDKTPNVKVSIINNTFQGNEVGVGTHNFSATKVNGTYQPNYHRQIRVVNNVFKNTQGRYAVHVMQWKNSTVSRNTITGIKSTTGIERGIIVDGSRNLFVSYNTISSVPRALAYRVVDSGGRGAVYGYAYNHISELNFSAWQTNTISTVTESFARWALGPLGADGLRRISLRCVAACGAYPRFGIPQTYHIPDPLPDPEPEPDPDPVDPEPEPDPQEPLPPVDPEGTATTFVGDLM